MSADVAQELTEVKRKIASTEAELNEVKKTVPLDVPRRDRLEEHLLVLEKKENLLLDEKKAQSGVAFECVRSILMLMIFRLFGDCSFSRLRCFTSTDEKYV